MYSEEILKLGSAFIQSLNFLLTLEPSKYTSIQDEHFENIIRALDSKLPFKPLQISQLYQLFVLIYQHQDQDEYKIEKCHRVLQSLLDFDTQEKQLNIILITKILLSMENLPQPLMTLSMVTLNQIFNKEISLINDCLPLLSSKLFSLLVTFPHTRTQTEGIKLLTLLTNQVLNKYCSLANNKEYQILNLLQQQKTQKIQPTVQQQVQEKYNGLIIWFAKNLKHAITPQINTIYSQMVQNILSHKNCSLFFKPEAYLELMKLFIAHSNSRKPQLSILQNCIDKSIPRNTYFRIQVVRLIYADLLFLIRKLPCLTDELDTQRTLTQLRQAKYWMLFIDEEYYYNEELERELCTALLKTFKYNFNPNISIVVTEINMGELKLKQSGQFEAKLDESNYLLQKLHFELMPITNFDKEIYNEVNQLFIESNCKFLQRCFKERLLLKLVENFHQIRTHLSSNQEIIIPLQDILMTSTLLFCLNLFLEGYLYQHLQLSHESLYAQIINTRSIQLDQSGFATLVQKYQDEIYNMSFLLFFNQPQQIINIFQVQMLQGCFKSFLYLSSTFEITIFEKTQIVEFLLKQESQSSQIIHSLAQTYLQFLADSFDQTNSIDSLVQQYSPSVIQRNIILIQNLHLQSDKNTPLQIIKHILLEYRLQENLRNQVYQVLQTLSQVFDKYYLNSDIQFTSIFIGFLKALFKKWTLTDLDNDFVAIIRKIILQIHQFITHKTLQCLALECFYHTIPILTQKPLSNQTPDKGFGMNDANNVTISNTLGVVFAEIKYVFENGILQLSDVPSLNYFWKIVNRIYEIDQSLVYFQCKNQEEIYIKHMRKSLFNRDINLQVLKVKYEIVRFLHQYFTISDKFQQKQKFFEMVRQDIRQLKESSLVLNGQLFKLMQEKLMAQYESIIKLQM